MTVQMQIDEFSREQATVAVYIDSRPIYWTAHVSYQDVPEAPNQQVKAIIYQPFILQVINKLTDINITTDNLKTNIDKALKELKKKTNNNFKSIIRVHFATEAMVKQLVENEDEDNYLNTKLGSYC